MVVPIGANLGQKKNPQLDFEQVADCFVAHSGINN